LHTTDKAVFPILQTFAQHESKQLHIAALGALIRCKRAAGENPPFDDLTRKLIANALQDDETFAVISTIQLLLTPLEGGGGYMTKFRLMYMPELIPLLFYDDEEVRRQARGALRYIDEKDAPKPVEELLTIVRKGDDPKMISALRGLAAMGKHARDAIPALKEVLKQNKDDGTLSAAFAAIDRIMDESTPVENQPRERGHSARLTLSPEERTTLNEKWARDGTYDAVLKEFENLFPPSAAGGGFGGGGGFF
jgi:hypothetical protein